MLMAVGRSRCWTVASPGLASGCYAGKAWRTLSLDWRDASATVDPPNDTRLSSFRVPLPENDEPLYWFGTVLSLFVTA